MQQISRRGLLKGLASLPLVAALDPFSNAWGKGATSSELRVWFHGLFALVFDDSGITALTPYVKDHVYRAQAYINGAWAKPMYDLESKDYKLVGAPSGKPRPPRTKDDAIVDDITQVEHGKSYLSIRFPFPDKVSPGRRITSTFVTCPGNPHKIPGSHFPLLHIFTYRDVADPAALKLDPDIPFGAAGQTGIDFHIYAEPDTVVSSQHANQAFAQLMTIFPQLCLSVSQPGVDPNQCPPLDPSLNAEQQLGLAERDHQCKLPPKKRQAKKPIVHHYFAIETSDCSQILVNPGH
jgi:hypothetical protein